MSASVLYMSMSLDGYIAGPNDGLDNPGGDDFHLHDWFTNSAGELIRPDGEPGQLVDEINATGAVLIGRRLADQIDHWNGDHHGVPIFVVSHRPPGPSVADYPSVTYVTDGIVSAMEQAKAAAGDRDVMVHGAYTAQRAIEAGVLDELADPSDPGAARPRPTPVRRAALASEPGDRSGHRYPGGHTPPLPHPPLSRSKVHECIHHRA